VDLGMVVLERAPMLGGRVVWPDGRPAEQALVTAIGPTGKIVQARTNGEGRFLLEPPEPGEYRIDAGRPAGALRGSHREKLWIAPERRVYPGSETRLELRYVPAVLVEFVGPEPRPPGFHWNNVVVVARSADGREEYDFLPEGPKRRVIYLYGRGPWTLVARHRALETVEVPLGCPDLTPDDALPVHRIELRKAAEPPQDVERRSIPR
jgi:hypothetical protein